MKLNETQLIDQFKFQISHFKTKMIFEVTVGHRLSPFAVLMIYIYMYIDIVVGFHSDLMF